MHNLLKFVLIVIFSIPTQGIYLHAQPIDCESVLEIWQIQGSGNEANCLGEKIITENNLVTATGANGFFIQTSDNRIDDNDTTSNGIYVYTNRLPELMSVNIGDLVHVKGKVEEYFGFSQLEALTSSRITIVSSGNKLPKPINLLEVDLTTSDAASHPMERYEGMLVQVTNGFVNAPTNQFDEFGISLTGNRSLREAGFEPDDLPDLVGLGLPQWDLNPEVVEVDPAEMGMPVEFIPSFSQATVTGALAYSYLDYQIWTTNIDISSSIFEPRPVRIAAEDEFTIATQNVLNLFDTVDDPNKVDGKYEDWVPFTPEDYQHKLLKLSEQIRVVLNAPDILALQEVENSRVLNDLIFQIYEDDLSVRYTSCLLEGNEGRGIDVGYLIRLERINIYDCYRLPGSLTATYNNGDDLFTRPPLVLEAELIHEGEAFPITLINVHNRSLSDADTDRVQQKRMLQAMMIAEYVQERLIDNPAVNLVVLGDFNAFQFSDGLVDVMGIITGTHNPSEAIMAPENDLVEPNLINQIMRLPVEERYSFIWNSNPQVLDHILTSPHLDQYVSDIQFGRGNADVPLTWETSTGAIRSSDHDGLVLYLKPQFD